MLVSACPGILLLDCTKGLTHGCLFDRSRAAHALLLLDLVQKYKRLYDNNERVGTFYLQSKVERAKECIEATIKAKEAAGAKPKQ